MAGNPFRKQASADNGENISSDSGSPFIKTRRKSNKKVSFVSPLSSPTEEIEQLRFPALDRLHEGARASPPPTGLRPGQFDTRALLRGEPAVFLPASNNEEQNISASNDTFSENGRGGSNRQLPANPFAISNEVISNNETAGIPAAQESGKKPLMDVDAFKRLLLTGSAGGSSAPKNLNTRPGQKSSESMPRDVSRDSTGPLTELTASPTSSLTSDSEISSPEVSKIDPTTEAPSQHSSKIDIPSVDGVLTKPLVPPPPPTSRRQASKTIAKTVDEDATVDSAEGAVEPAVQLAAQKSKPPPPPSRSTTRSDRPATPQKSTQIQSTTSSEIPEQPSEVAATTRYPFTTAPPLPPNRTKRREANRSSLEKSDNRRFSFQSIDSRSETVNFAAEDPSQAETDSTTANVTTIESTRKSSVDMLADLDAFQRELDTLRMKASAGK